MWRKSGFHAVLRVGPGIAVRDRREPALRLPPAWEGPSEMGWRRVGRWPCLGSQPRQHRDLGLPASRSVSVHSRCPRPPGCRASLWLQCGLSTLSWARPGLAWACPALPSRPRCPECPSQVFGAQSLWGRRSVRARMGCALSDHVCAGPRPSTLKLLSISVQALCPSEKFQGTSSGAWLFLPDSFSYVRCD